VGYNGFPAGVDDSNLPNYGPEKYPYMVHAEANAIYNTTAPLKDAIAYVSGYSCSECIKAMWQCGIKNIHYCEWSKPKVEYDKENREKIAELFMSTNIYEQSFAIQKHDIPGITIRL
jgi:dCMP deaminase